MTFNQAQMSSFVSGKVSSGPLFSYTFPDRPSFLTSLQCSTARRAFSPLSQRVDPSTGTGATPSCARLAFERPLEGVEGTKNHIDLRRMPALYVELRF
jgi:hypothetical protein